MNKRNWNTERIIKNWNTERKILGKECREEY